jgi:hypothetical protein
MGFGLRITAFLFEIPGCFEDWTFWLQMEALCGGLSWGFWRRWNKSLSNSY